MGDNIPDYMEHFNFFDEAIGRGDKATAKSQMEIIKAEHYGLKAEEYMKKNGICWSYKNWLNDAEKQLKE